MQPVQQYYETKSEQKWELLNTLWTQKYYEKNTRLVTKFGSCCCLKYF